MVKIFKGIRMSLLGPLIHGPKQMESGKGSSSLQARKAVEKHQEPRC
jgi:hypothetical protein